jgi:hypothetical protein
MPASDSDVSFEDLDEVPEIPSSGGGLRGSRRYSRSSSQPPSRQSHSDGDSEEDEPGVSRSLPSVASSHVTRPRTWQDVDRDDLSRTALKLISNVASTAPTDDKAREAVWHPTTTITVTAELNDPLGLGRIDPVDLRLVRSLCVLVSPAIPFCRWQIPSLLPAAVDAYKAATSLLSLGNSTPGAGPHMSIALVLYAHSQTSWSFKSIAPMSCLSTADQLLLVDQLGGDCCMV